LGATGQGRLPIVVRPGRAAKPPRARGVRGKKGKGRREVGVETNKRGGGGNNCSW